MHRLGKKGFTLVELLAVIAIIGILASILMVNVIGSKGKSRDARRIADVKNIQLALSLYYNDNGMYPTDIYNAACTASLLAPSCGLTTVYLPTVPLDPAGTATAGTYCNAGGQYCYKSYNSNSPASGVCNATKPVTKYHIGAVLEDATNIALNGQDVDAPTAPNGAMVGYTACSTGGTGDFDGTSITCNGTAGTPQGQANPTEKCYDQTP